MNETVVQVHLTDLDNRSSKTRIVDNTPLINYPDSDTVIENEELIEALANLQPVLNQSWSDLKNTLSSAATLVSFAKNSLLTSG